jgi:hypothetical protein
VWGVDEHGRRIDPAEFEYQICFKCHGDSANQPQGDATSPFAPRRRSRDVNLRRVFAADAPSSHPVIAPGRNADVPSLRAPLTAASLVRCTDCHASDTGRGTGGNGPRGPHGSTYPALLERQYATADFTSESPAAYALCYKCHDRDVLLSDRSAFRLHRAHVIDRRAPCSTCHVAHGVSAKTGTSENNAHLVDFDVGIVSPAPGGLSYASAGTRSGSCTLTCHGHRHDAARY